MILLSGLAPPLGLCRGGDLCGLYSALSQDGKMVVEDIPLVVWGLCFGKVGGVISFLFGPVSSDGATLSPDSSCLSLHLCCSSLCVGGIGSVCYIWSTSPVLSGVLCEFSLSRALGPCLRPTWHDDTLLSPVHLEVRLLQLQLFCLQLWNPDLFTGHATCPRPAVF